MSSQLSRIRKSQKRGPRTPTELGEVGLDFGSQLSDQFAPTPPQGVRVYSYTVPCTGSSGMRGCLKERHAEEHLGPATVTAKAV